MRQAKHHDATCLRCQKPFLSSRKTRRYCSHACQAADSAWKKWTDATYDRAMLKIKKWAAPIIRQAREEEYWDARYKLWIAHAMAMDAAGLAHRIPPTPWTEARGSTPLSRPPGPRLSEFAPPIKLSRPVAYSEADDLSLDQLKADVKEWSAATGGVRFFRGKS